MLSLQFFFIFLLLTSSVCVLFVKNPVHSVLFLILAFCNAAALLFIFKAEFLGLIFIIIYVGAIAILFLFVVMMLNVKIYSSQNIFFNFPFLFLTGCLVLLQVFLMFDTMIGDADYGMVCLPYEFTNSWDTLYSIDTLGQSLYNYYLSCFLLAGFILLIAMVGAIVLTLNFSSHRKSELVSRQLSRTTNFLAFFKEDVKPSPYLTITGVFGSTQIKKISIT
jgi:NADH-quinone oxidoreductase subunit J